MYGNILISDDRQINEHLDELSLRLDVECLERCWEETSLADEKRSITNDIHELKRVADILVQKTSNKISG